MNILILNWKDLKHPQAGGAEIIVYELAKRLVKDGHDVTWFARSFKGGKKQEEYKGIRVVRRGNLITTYLFAPLYYLTLKRKPDLVIDMSNTIYWQTPLWAHRSDRVAYLNQLAQEVFDYEYSFPLAKLGQLAEKIQYLTYKNTPFICYSNSTKQDLVKMGIPEENIQLFTMGLDHDRYYPGAKSDEPLFLAVSRLVKMKRTDLTIRAFKKVVKKHPKAKLLIIGYGYERERLEKIRDKLELQENVLFLDEDILFFEKSVKDKKIDAMQRSWALIFPSVKEGWGMTVTECAACGTPSIVSDVTGLRDSVKKNETGIVVSKNPTEKELANAINKIVDDNRLRKRLSKNAIEWSKRFNWEDSYSGFSKALERVVDK